MQARGAELSALLSLPLSRGVFAPLGRLTNNDFSRETRTPPGVRPVSDPLNDFNVDPIMPRCAQVQPILAYTRVHPLPVPPLPWR